jgi:hypothetical protein
VILTGDRLGKDGKLASAIKGRALRVVYPAHLDAAGHMVPKTIAYALVDLPDWAERQTGPVMTVDGKVATGVSRGLLGAAEHAPDALAVLPASTRASVADPQLADAAPTAALAGLLLNRVRPQPRPSTRSRPRPRRSSPPARSNRRAPFLRLEATHEPVQHLRAPARNHHR